jgi:hypothetical protein
VVPDSPAGRQTLNQGKRSWAAPRSCCVGDSFLLVRKAAVSVGAVKNACSSDNDAILRTTSLTEAQRPRVLGPTPFGLERCRDVENTSTASPRFSFEMKTMKRVRRSDEFTADDRNPADLLAF